ncbi:calmodulin-binding transcription activator 2-like, partial [Penaeus indicus]|uniref:calmodulin-binding transcription activator 2-like n=1 Tax=Penaeus indicus TaxID=29960 RepID=UPI00300CF195
REQRELYEAAKTIQKAYRLYKGRKRLQEQDKERQAAIVIQNYYRRYKQYVYFRQMSRAATLIQNQFRSYCEHKRFKKSLEGGTHTGVNFSLRGSRETTPIPTLKRTYSQRRQHQAARKIQQFMRQTKQKLQRERAQAAEREKVGQAAGPGCQGPAVGGTAAVGGAAVTAQQPLPPPALLHQLPPARAGPSSELSLRDTDPLLSSTAHAPDQTDHQDCH